MCGVVDNNVASEVFGDRQTAAGKGFRDWLDGRQGSLAVGGDLASSPPREIKRPRNR